jgi:hypothetical protein
MLTLKWEREAREWVLMLSVAKVSLSFFIPPPFLLGRFCLYWPCLNVSTFMRFTTMSSWDDMETVKMKWELWWHYSWTIFFTHLMLSFLLLFCIYFSRFCLIIGLVFIFTSIFASHATYLKCDWSWGGKFSSFEMKIQRKNAF